MNLPFKTLDEWIKYVESIKVAVIRELKDCLKDDLKLSKDEITSSLKYCKWETPDKEAMITVLSHNKTKLCAIELWPDNLTSSWKLGFYIYPSFKAIEDRLERLKREEIF